MDTEKVTVEIQLTPTFWDVAPIAKVFLDNEVLFSGEMREPQKLVHTTNMIEGTHEIRVMLMNKNGRRDTILEDGKIVKDMLLTVDSILLDDIDLGFIINTKGNYKTDEGVEHPNMTSLGWNGTWTLPFTSPVYMWLLENL